ncbi:Gfo/Idh/MocA family protein [Actinomadura sp. 3N407]|uniref:Gfo/Idh/MocA family protein n=1 Tax=Actinomadura sp. 3N407 TaxID=3457423 RepID=UPI003FCE4778
MRVGFAGLATTFHPGADARLLRERGITDLVVWGDDGRFAAEHGARPVTTLDDLVAARPDAAVVTCRPSAVPEVVRRLTGAAIPVFVTKPAIGTRTDLDRLDEVVAATPTPVTTCSVLRFAPAVGRLRQRLRGATVLGVRATVRHSVAAYLAPERRWLDDPAEGGGTLLTMGLHGVELISALLGPGLTARWATGAVHVHHGTLSEDTGVIALSGPGGRYAVVEVLGATRMEGYDVTAQTPEGAHTVSIAEGDADPMEAFGYAGTVDAFLNGIAAGRAAVPWATAREVLSAVLEARSPR